MCYSPLTVIRPIQSIANIDCKRIPAMFDVYMYYRIHTCIQKSSSSTIEVHFGPERNLNTFISGTKFKET